MALTQSIATMATDAYHHHSHLEKVVFCILQIDEAAIPVSVLLLGLSAVL